MKSNDRKSIKWFNGHKAEVSAVLIEAQTRLHSDTYIVVMGDKFQTDFEPFKVKLSYCVGDTDSPIDDSNTIHRIFDIRGPRDLYVLTSTIYQMMHTRQIAEYFGIGFFVEIVQMVISCGPHIFKWVDTDNPRQKTLTEFMELHMMHVDTDEFLDAALPLDQRAERGHYRSKPVHTKGERNQMLRQMYDRGSDMTRIEYYYTERKAYLYLHDNDWTLDITNPNRVRSDSYGDGDPDAFFDPATLSRIDAFRSGLIEKGEVGSVLVGTCITGTGLLYISRFEIALLYDRISLFEVTPFFRNDPKQIGMGGEDGSHDFIASDILDIMQLAVYLPQLMDINRYLWGVDPAYINIMIVLDRDSYATDDVVIPEDETHELGIQCDLLHSIAELLMSERFKEIQNADDIALDN